MAFGIVLTIVVLTLGAGLLYAYTRPHRHEGAPPPPSGLSRRSNSIPEYLNGTSEPASVVGAALKEWVEAAGGTADVTFEDAPAPPRPENGNPRDRRAPPDRFIVRTAKAVAAGDVVIRVPPTRFISSDAISATPLGPVLTAGVAHAVATLDRFPQAQQRDRVVGLAKMALSVLDALRPNASGTAAAWAPWLATLPRYPHTTGLYFSEEELACMSPLAASVYSSVRDEAAAIEALIAASAATAPAAERALLRSGAFSPDAVRWVTSAVLRKTFPSQAAGSAFVAIPLFDLLRHQRFEFTGAASRPPFELNLTAADGLTVTATAATAAGTEVVIDYALFAPGGGLDPVVAGVMFGLFPTSDRVAFHIPMGPPAKGARPPAPGGLDSRELMRLCGDPRLVFVNVASGMPSPHAVRCVVELQVRGMLSPLKGPNGAAVPFGDDPRGVLAKLTERHVDAFSHACVGRDGEVLKPLAGDTAVFAALRQQRADHLEAYSKMLRIVEDPALDLVSLLDLPPHSAEPPPPAAGGAPAEPPSAGEAEAKAPPPVDAAPEGGKEL